MDYVEISYVSLDLSTIYVLVLVGVELPLCIVDTPFWIAITSFWNRVEYKIVLFYLLCHSLS